MSRSITDARQVALRRFLEQIGNRTHHDGTTDAKPAGQSELDNLLDSLDLELTPPLRMDASNPVDLVVSIGPAIVANTETNRNRTIPHIGSLLPNSFASGTVTFPATSGNTITVSPGNNGTLTVTSNNYIKILIYMDANGDLNVLPGVENAVEANATVLPAPNNTLPIGYVTLFNNAGTIDNIAQSKIYQFGTGAGGASGTGNADSIVETLKNRLLDSPFEAVTPNVFRTDEDNLIDGSSTGAYSLVTNNFAFGAAAETMVSIQMLDSAFLTSGKGVNEVELMAFWDLANIDTAATYAVSRNGGNEWQTITMSRVDSTELYRGIHEFTTEASNQTILTQATKNTTDELDTTNAQQIGQLFTLANDTELREVVLSFAKNGTPDGNIFVSIYDNNAGDPGTQLVETNAITIASLTTGDNTIDIPNVVLSAGTYHIVVKTDAAYKATFVTTTKSLVLDGNSGGTDGETYNGTAWAAAAYDLAYIVKGIELDLRVRITSSAAANLDGYGIFYDKGVANIVTGVKNREVFNFQAVADNDNSFTLTKFVPEPDLLDVYYIQAGQVYKYPAFVVNGQVIEFPVNQFNNGGVEADVTLVFDQTRGGAFDNSDLNALLLAGNFLGSTDASIDRSANGRGIFLRRPDGTLREIAIDDSDNIVVYSV